MNDEVAEVLETLERIVHEFEDLAVGGLRALGPERVTSLRAMAAEFSRIGVLHISDRLQQLADAIDEGDRSAAEKLMRAQSSVRMFERMLTLETATVALAKIARDESDSAEGA